MKKIIVAVVQFKNKVLILKRKSNKHFDPGKWEFVSGIINNERNLEKFAKERVLFETGLKAQLVREGEKFNVKDKYGEWLIHPFLFLSDFNKVVLQEDHDEYQWIVPSELRKFDTVQELSKNLIAVNL